MPDARNGRAWGTVLAALAVIAGVTFLGLPEGAQREEQPVAARPQPPFANSSVSADEHSVRALLHRRANAIRSRDEAAFMASVDPHTDPGFRRAQRELFHNLAEVPLVDWSYELDAHDTVAAPPVTGADDTWAPRVRLSYAIAGVDAVSTRRPLGYVFSRRGDSWYLAADEGTERDTWRGPWDFGACRVIRTESGLILGHDDNRELAQRVAGVLDESTAAVTEVWGTDWSRRVGFLLPSSPEELRSMVGPEFAVDGIAAVAVADEVDTARRRVAGPRIVLNPGTAGRLSDTALRVVVQHEITHIAARADTTDDAPMWMLEGFADYVGYRGSGLPPERIAPELALQARAGTLPSDLPSEQDFWGTKRQLDLAYQRSWSIVDFLARRFGEQRVVELYHRIARSDSLVETQNALRELTGLSMAELVGQWRAELRETMG